MSYRHPIRPAVRPAAFVAILALTPLVACSGAGDTPGDLVEDVAEDLPVATDACTGAGYAIDIGCAAPPNTFDTAELAGTANGTAWDTWAWNTFAALNWPALRATDQTTYPTGYVRGVPNTSASFAGAASDDAVVWETFKEKRELFNDNAGVGRWQDVTFPPETSPDFLPGGQIPMCTTGTVSQEVLARVRTNPRVITQLQKASPSLDGVNTGDETAEVASPPQEPQSALCAGYSGAALATCQDSLFVNPQGGNEDTPFTPTERNPRPPVGPRVFKGDPSAEGFIYYEVKLNYDYYHYVASNGYNDYDSTLIAARAARVHLPYRTSADTAPGDSSTARLTRYDAAQTRDCYAAQLAGCALRGQSVSPSALPKLGAIQLKSAWLPVSQLDGSADDYHTTEAVYFRTPDQSQPGSLCYAIEQFGLIGLHIIQRVHGGDSGKAQPIGGTFIFATWEHESIANGSGYTYVSYLADKGQEQTSPNPYPNTPGGIPVERQSFTVGGDTYTYPLASTAAVTTTVHAALPPTSVWQNYRLIGTQFVPVNSQADSYAIGQPYYLANLVVETNRGLQNFQGLPPGVTPIAQFANKIGRSPATSFEPDSANVSFNGTGFVMGGCMGCHGVAQAFGFNFSFVLQDGSRGTGPDTKEKVLIPPIAPPSG